MFSWNLTSCVFPLSGWTLLSNSFYLQFVREVGKEFGNTFWPFSSSDEYNAKAFLSDQRKWWAFHIQTETQAQGTLIIRISKMRRHLNGTPKKHFTPTHPCFRRMPRTSISVNSSRGVTSGNDEFMALVKKNINIGGEVATRISSSPWKGWNFSVFLWGSWRRENIYYIYIHRYIRMYIYILYCSIYKKYIYIYRYPSEVPLSFGSNQ